MPEHQQTHQSTESKTTSQRQATPRIQTPLSNPYSIIQRARINPKSLTHADVLQLQSTIGNRVVGKLLSEIRNSSKVQQLPIQRSEVPKEEKEPLQGIFGKEPEEETCPSCVQRQEKPEEEEPLQGKFETIQRLEPEDKEKTQMKSVVQRQEISEEEDEPVQGKILGTIQRQEMPEEEPLQTKRENNTGMPDNLKAGVENLSGIDMSDVRVHYNSLKPAEVGALAYTQGTDIHVASGQEKHLPHEAWHVVQQAQGRVKPTMQLKGVAVNDDERLEHEADVMGAKAASLNSGFELPTPVHAPIGIVQCAVGFEWEIESLKLTEVTKKGDRAEPASLPSKAVAYRRGGVRLEVDSEHGEFVTEPAETMNQLKAQLEIIKDVKEDLIAAGGNGLYMTAPGDIVYTDDKESKLGTKWMNKGDWIHAVNIGTTMIGTLQGTSGIDFTPKALYEELKKSVQHTGKDKRDWMEWLGKQTTEINISEKVNTLILAIKYFINACAGGDQKAKDGPKTWMPLLLRTDFRSMFNALDPSEKKEFETWVQKYPNQDNYLCPEGYSSANGYNQGPTIAQWLQSILVGRDDRKDPGRQADKDIMSPPPGFALHITSASKEQDAKEGKPVANPIPYAMGLYGLDEGRIVAEQRSMDEKNINYENMASKALEFASFHNITEVIEPDPPESDVDMVGPYKGDDSTEPKLEIDKTKRNWYQALCRQAKETIKVYGKGMFDYGSIRDGKLDEVGEVRLTPEHYDLFKDIRLKRKDIKFNRYLLAYVHEEMKDKDERINAYIEEMDQYGEYPTL